MSNKFLAKRVEENNNSLVFKINIVINTTKNGETKICRAIQKLKHLGNQSDGNDKGSDRQQIAEQSKFLDIKYFGGGKKMEEDLDFFNNDAIQPNKRKYETKKIKPYNTTRIKSRNFLTKISYNEEDFWDRRLVFDVYVLARKNVNPFSL